ncbi:MAG: AraC family transcriptional regulator ligand-binding domain-containing protein [Pseudomonadota bacterium]
MKNSSRHIDHGFVAVSYAYDLLHVMAERGADSEAIIRDSGVPRALLTGHDSRLSLVHFGSLVQACSRHGSVAGLGYAFGLGVKPHSHGMLGLAIHDCRSLREAAQLAERFYHLRVGVVRLSLVDDAAFSGMRVEVDAVPALLREFTCEAVMSMLLRFVQQAAGPGVGAEIWFEHAEPAHHRDWAGRLPPVRFGRPENQLRLPRHCLDQPLAAANPLAARAAVQQMEVELERIGAPAGTAAAVRQQLLLARDDLPALPVLAARLNVSASTLKRRLQLEGASFQGLLDGVRRDHACELLRQPLRSVEQVARQLGYSDAANFTRAFRKWTGQAPSAWRRQY